MGLPFLTKPVLFHSVRETHDPNMEFPDYNSWLKKQPFLNWYAADWDYGYATLYFFCGGIAFFVLANLLGRIKLQGRSSIRTPVAFYRYLSARQYYIARCNWYSPPLGQLVIVGAMIIFAIVLSLAKTPYYWPAPGMGHSPPLGTRAGWISIAIMPFMFAFATKVNWVGYLTGVHPEQLQVFHRWTAWIMWATSLIHTFPFIVYNIKQGLMVEYYRTKVYYWTGVAALIPQTWLVIMSIGPIRNRYYETFKKLHYLVSLMFMFFLFIHCNFRLTSWHYFWATLAIWFSAWSARYIRAFFYNGLHHRATLTPLADNLTQISVPTRLRWKVGQHFSVRFIGMGAHAWTAHPFTAASIPEVDAGSGKESVVEFYSRGLGGITERMLSFAKKGGVMCRVVLDGPYGGYSVPMTDFETVLLLAGGSGASFITPTLLDLAQRYDSSTSRPRMIHLIWAVRRQECISWFEGALARAAKVLPQDVLKISIFVTDDVNDSSSLSDEDDAQDEKKFMDELGMERLVGRPDLAALVEEYANTESSSLGIATCGPSSFNLDVRNAVAKVQLDIAKGKHKTCGQVHLHCEAFGW